MGYVDDVATEDDIAPTEENFHEVDSTLEASQDRVQVEDVYHEENQQSEPQNTLEHEVELLKESSEQGK